MIKIRYNITHYCYLNGNLKMMCAVLRVVLLWNVMAFFVFCQLDSANTAERAHEHGVGQISIAVEGTTVEIELIVPGADAVGFENNAVSDDDKEKVANATKALRIVDKIITLSPEAKCHVEEIEVHSGFLENKQDKPHRDHDHTPKDTGKQNNTQKEEHSEFTAHYHFKCEKPERLNGAQVGFFATFPSARELDAKWITPKGQGAKELTANSPKLVF